jgi:hypothetical protein
MCTGFRKNIRIEIQLGLLQAIHPKELIRGQRTYRRENTESGPPTKVNELYKSVITAGTHFSINVAKPPVIENSQRDINIAFVNELAKYSI